MAEPTNQPHPTSDNPEKKAPEPGLAHLAAQLQPPPTFATDRPTETAGYRPLSGLAIAGFVLALLYALFIVLMGGTAYAVGGPLLLGVWSLVPVLSAVLSLAAWLRIARSEGTQGGLALAQWGWWLSVLFGLGYGAYYVTTYLAIRDQANAYAHLWFDKIKQGKVNAAFMDTQAPSVRQGVNSADELAMNIRFNQPSGPSTLGPLGLFKQHQVVQAIQQGGPDTQFQPQGVANWTYQGGGYRISRNYLAETPEGTFEMVVTVQGTDTHGKTAEKRQWMVIWTETALLRSERNALGEQRAKLRTASQQFLQGWGDKLVQGNMDEAYLDTRPPDMRPALRREYGSRRAAAALAGVTLSLVAGAWSPLPAALVAAGPTLIPDVYLPGFGSFASGFVQIDDRTVQADDPATLRTMRPIVQDLFRPAHPGFTLRGLAMANPTAHPWRIQDGRLQYTHDGELNFGTPEFFARYTADVEVVVETELPATQQSAHTPVWRVVSMKVIGVKDRTRPSEDEMGRPS